MNKFDEITLKTDSGEVLLDPYCFLVFIDETGHEIFADKKYPLFGLGGCGVLARDYYRLINAPWKSLKNNLFEGEKQRLHAKELHKPSNSQVRGLGDFFKTNYFCRMATIITDKTLLEGSFTPYEIAGSYLMQQIEKFASRQPLNDIAIIFETSKRSDSLAVKLFSKYDKIVKEYSNSYRSEGRIYKYFMSKSANEPGLEVADFIINTAGKQVRDSFSGEDEYTRKDFIAVFKHIDRKFIEFIKIDKVIANS